jgi:hypothetical protein
MIANRIRPKPKNIVAPNKTAGTVIEITFETRIGIVLVVNCGLERVFAVRVTIIGNVRVHQA